MREQTRKMTDDPIILRIMDQLSLQGKTEKELVRYLGLSDTAFSSWKFQNVKTYIKRIDDIALFLGVSKNYLINGTDYFINQGTLTATEIKIIKQFRAMGNEQQKNYMKMGEFLVMSTNYEREGTDESNM